MCDTGNHAEVTPAEALPASLEWTGEVLPLEPVDELSVLTVCDNTMDLLLPDEGPASRLSPAGMGRQVPVLPAPTLREARCRTHRWPSTGSPRWWRSARAAGRGGCCSTPA
jgi:hypothetical protein